MNIEDLLKAIELAKRCKQFREESKMTKSERELYALLLQQEKLISSPERDSKPKTSRP